MSAIARGTAPPSPPHMHTPHTHLGFGPLDHPLLHLLPECRGVRQGLDQLVAPAPAGGLMVGVVGGGGQ